MARFTGPRAKVNRKFGEPIMGYTKALEKKNYPPGMHGTGRRRKSPSEYSIQLKEKQKIKFIYGVLERQFARFYAEASRRKGATGENLLKLLESRLDNTVYRLGMAPSRRAARQLVSHKHIAVNGTISNIASHTLHPGDKISVSPKSCMKEQIKETMATRGSKYQWLEHNTDMLDGTFVGYPEREQIPENVREQLVVELYSK